MSHGGHGLLLDPKNLKEAPHTGVLGFLGNAVSDAGSILSSFIPGTLAIGKDILTGNLSGLADIGKSIETNYAQRYGSLSGFLHGLYTQPVQFGLDVLGAGAVAGKVARLGASGAGELGQALRAEELAGAARQAGVALPDAVTGGFLPTFEAGSLNSPELGRLSKLGKAILPAPRPRTLMGTQGEPLAILPPPSDNPVARVLRGQEGPIHRLFTESVQKAESRATDLYNEAEALGNQGAMVKAQHLQTLAQRARELGLSRVERDPVRNARLKGLMLKELGHAGSVQLTSREEVANAFRAIHAALTTDEVDLAFSYDHGLGEHLVDPGVAPESTVLRDGSGNAKVYYHGTSHAFQNFDPAFVSEGNIMGPGFYFTDHPGIAASYTEARVLDHLDSLPVDAKLAFRDDLLREYQTARMRQGLSPGDLAQDVADTADFLDQWVAGRHPGSGLWAITDVNVPAFAKRWMGSTGNLGDFAPNVRPVHVRLNRPFTLDEGKVVGGHLNQQWLLSEGALLPPEEKAALQRVYLQEAGKPNALLDHATTYDEAWNAMAGNLGQDAANQVVRSVGYDGITHQGGIRAGGGQVLHEAAVVFDPKNTVPVYHGLGAEFQQRLSVQTDLDRLPIDPAAQMDQVAGLPRAELNDYGQAVLDLREKLGPNNVHWDDPSQRLIIEVPGVRDMSGTAATVAQSLGREGFYNVANYIDQDGPLGMKYLGLTVRTPNGKLAEVEVHTPWTRMARESLDGANRRLEALTAQNAADGSVGDQVLKHQFYIESIWGATKRIMEDELGGRPMTGLAAAREKKRLLIHRYITAPLMDSGKLTEVEAFDRAYIALRMLRGAEYDMDKGAFVPSKKLVEAKTISNPASFEEPQAVVGAAAHDAAQAIDPLFIHRDRMEQGLPAPIYVPHLDARRSNYSQWMLAQKSATGMRPSNAFGIHETTGYLIKDWVGDLQRALARTGGNADLERAALEVHTPGRSEWRHASGAPGLRAISNIPEVLSMRAARVQRFLEAERIIGDVLNRFSRELGYLGKFNQDTIGADERVFIPDGMLRFYHARIGLDDLFGRHGGDVKAAAQELVGSVLPKSLDDYAKDVVGVTTSGIKVHAVPRVVADALESSFGMRMGKSVRQFWDTPTNAWRSFVLQGSPRWMVNNFLGNVVFLKMQGGRLSDVVRQLDQTYRDRLQSLVPQGVEGGMYSTAQNYAAKLGLAGEGTVGTALQKVSEFTTDTPGLKHARSVGAHIYRMNMAMEDAFRRASYLKAGETELMRRGLLDATHRFHTSEETLRKLARYGADPKLAAKAVGEVNYFLNDYHSMTAFERNIVRRFLVPFWGFYRHVARLSVMYAVDYPLRAEVMANLGQLGQDMEQDQLGFTPGWLQGALPVGDTLLSTRGMNPFQSLVQGAIGATHPAIRSFYEMTTGKSTLTGRDFTAQGVISPFGSDTPFVVRGGQVFVSGKVHPSIMEELLSQVPLYTLAKQAATFLPYNQGGATYDTATLFDILRGQGIIRDNRGQAKYPGSPVQDVLGFLGAKFYPRSVLDAYQQHLAIDAQRALTQAQGGSSVHGGHG